MTNTKPTGMTKAQLVAELEKYRSAVTTITNHLHGCIARHDREIHENLGPNYMAENYWKSATAMVSALYFLGHGEHQAIWDRALDYVRSGRYAADEAARNAEYERVRAESAARLAERSAA